MLNASLMLVSSSMCKAVLLPCQLAEKEKPCYLFLDTLEIILGITICRRKDIAFLNNELIV
jgi:hypothetical protein